jgi:hypothetical protein
MAKNFDADVAIDLELPDAGLCFVVTNRGQSPARNVRFSVKEDLTWLSPEPGKKGLSSLDVIREGISYLRPGRTMKYYAGTVYSLKQQEDARTFSLELTYESNGQVVKREVSIDISQFASVLFESYRSPLHEISKSLDEIRDAIRQHGKQSPLTMFGRKPCSMCAEPIPSAAMKCSHCGEMQKSDSEA